MHIHCGWGWLGWCTSCSKLDSFVYQRLCAKAGMGRGPVSADDVALMSPEDVFLFRQQYSAYLGRLFGRGAHTEGCAAHAELLQIVALWVSHHSLPFTQVAFLQRDWQVSLSFGSCQGYHIDK